MSARERNGNAPPAKPRNEKCEIRDLLFQDWIRSADTYAGTLATLARHITGLSAQAESRIIENIDRAMLECEHIRARLLNHRTEHGC